MSGVLNGVKNATGMPAISAARSIIYRPDSGLPFQLFFDTLNKDIYVDQSNGWELFTSGPGKYNFGSGLRQLGENVTNNLTTGNSGGNIIFGFDDDLSGSGLQLWSTSEGGIYSNYILFGSWDDNGTAYFSNTGAWNFGDLTDPSLTTPYLYVFQSRGVFNARWDFDSNIALINTNGSHIQSVWQTSAPTGNANQTHLFFDSVGNPSFRIGTNNWFKFEPASLTATRTYTLQDSSYTLAGLNIAQTFSALQTFSAGATFGAAINAIAGNAAAPSINFGTVNTGIFGNNTDVKISVGGINVITFTTSGATTWSNGVSISSGGSITIGGNLNIPGNSIISCVSRYQLQSNANGNIQLLNSNATDFGLLQFGGTTSAFPAIRRNGTTLEIKLADNSAFAPIAIGNTINVVSPTSPNRTITMNIGGTTYYIPCKTTND